MQYSSSTSQPIAVRSSTESQAYLLFTLAMGLTLLGVYLGIVYADILLLTGWHGFFLLAEIALIFTSFWWSRMSPLNMVLFALFPILSGITVTPYILSVLVGFSNGAAILFNAIAATIAIALSAAVFSRIAPNLSAWAGAFILAFFGLLFLTVLQIFFPALQTPGFELAISGAGIVIFAFFTAFDIQRLRPMAAMGANPFMLALSLYLDIFNLFLMVLRFMGALSGNRR